MFTGIIEAFGQVEKVDRQVENISFWLSCPFVNELKVDQSLAHDGVCLTVDKIQDSTYRVTAIPETLSRTNLDNWSVGTLVNLERCLSAHGRFDGHIVQGHVDTVGRCSRIESYENNWRLFFEYPTNTKHISVEKGSICINGVSLTVVDSGENTFSVAIIPYTWEHTNLGKLSEGSFVNLEFDVIGKYVAKMLGQQV